MSSVFVLVLHVRTIVVVYTSASCKRRFCVLVSIVIFFTYTILRLNLVFLEQIYVYNKQFA